MNRTTRKRGVGRLVRAAAAALMIISTLGAGTGIAAAHIGAASPGAPRFAARQNAVQGTVIPAPTATSCPTPVPTATPAAGSATATPTAPCSPDIQLLVSSHDDKSVLRYDGISGMLLDRFVPSGTGGLNGAHALGLDYAGNLYVTDDANNSLLRYCAPPAGQFPNQGPGGSGAPCNPGAPLPSAGHTGATFVISGSGGLSHPTGLAFGPGGDLYITSAGTNSVLRFNANDGSPLPVAGQSGADYVPTGSGGLSNPSALTFGPEGNLYVASASTNSILKYNGTTGAFESTFVISGSGGLSDPSGLTFGSDFNLYVTSKGANSVLRFCGPTNTACAPGAALPATGQTGAAFVPAGSGGLSSPSALTIGSYNNLYVASAGTNSILSYDANTGAFITTTVHAGADGPVNPQGFFYKLRILSRCQGHFCSF